MKIYISEGIWAEVTYYNAPCPMRITGTGFGDAEPPEEEEIDFHLVDDDDNKLTNIEITGEMEEQVLKEYKTIRGNR